MTDTSPLVVDVREVLEAPGSRKHLEFAAPLPDLRAGLAALQGDVRFDVTLEALGEGVLVQGQVSGETVGECRRCLEKVGQAFTLEGAELYRPAADVWEEGYAIKEHTIDLEPFAHDLIGLGLTTDPLCRLDCAGLCSRCGQNLNEGACECGEEIDARWSALKELQGLREASAETAADRVAEQNG